jgi:hypothetical protein
MVVMTNYHNTTLVFLFISSMLISIYLLSTTACADTTPTPTTEEVLVQIEKLKSDTDDSILYKDAELLATMVRRQDYVLVKSAEIDALIDLLQNDNDWIRSSAAAALGNLKSSARRAVPALEKALRERECVGGALTSTPIIREALKEIGRVPPTPRTDCPSPVFSG